TSSGRSSETDLAEYGLPCPRKSIESSQQVRLGELGRRIARDRRRRSPTPLGRKTRHRQPLSAARETPHSPDNTGGKRLSFPSGSADGWISCRRRDDGRS